MVPICILLLLSLSLAESDVFMHTLRPRTSICYEEQIPETMGYLWEVDYFSEDIALDILAPGSGSIFDETDDYARPVFQDEGGYHFRFPSAAFNSGEYKFCVYNQG